MKIEKFILLQISNTHMATTARKVVAKKASTNKSNKPTLTPAQRQAKQNRETKAFEQRTQACVESGLIHDSADYNNRNFHDKCGQAFTMYVLERIKVLQTTQQLDDAWYPNPYPDSKFSLLDDKMNKGNARSRAVKTKENTSATTATGLPIKKRVPVVLVKKPTDIKVDLEVAEVSDVDAKTEEVKVEAQVNNTTDEKAPKKVAKRSVVVVSKKEKSWLAFIVNRFVYEVALASMEANSPTVKSESDFANFVYTKISQDLRAHITRSIVPTVERLGDLVANIGDHKFDSELSEGLKVIKSASLISHTKKFLLIYFKLLGYVTAAQLWTHSGAGADIESAMQLLDMGNHQWLVKNEVCKEGECDMGLDCGIILFGRQVVTMQNPLPTPEELKKRADKRAESKNKNKKPADASTTPEEAAAAEVAAEVETEDSNEQNQYVDSDGNVLTEEEAAALQADNAEVVEEATGDNVEEATTEVVEEAATEVVEEAATEAVEEVVLVEPEPEVKKPLAVKTVKQLQKRVSTTAVPKKP